MYLTFLDIIQLDKITSSEISRTRGAASAHLRPADPAGRLLASPLPRRRPAYRRGHPFRLLRTWRQGLSIRTFFGSSYSRLTFHDAFSCAGQSLRRSVGTDCFSTCRVLLTLFISS